MASPDARKGAGSKVICTNRARMAIEGGLTEKPAKLIEVEIRVETDRRRG